VEVPGWGGAGTRLKGAATFFFSIARPGPFLEVHAGAAAILAFSVIHGGDGGASASVSAAAAPGGIVCYRIWGFEGQAAGGSKARRPVGCSRNKQRHQRRGPGRSMELFIDCPHWSVRIVEEQSSRGDRGRCPPPWTDSEGPRPIRHGLGLCPNTALSTRALVGKGWSRRPRLCGPV